MNPLKPSQSFPLKLVALGIAFTLSMVVESMAGVTPPPDVVIIQQGNNANDYPLEIASKLTQLSGYRFRLVKSDGVQIGSPASENGDTDEQPVHPARFVDPVYVGVCPISNMQYDALPGNTPESSANRDHGSYSNRPKQPATRVTYDEALEYAARVHEAARSQFGQAGIYSIPPEEVWEAAARESGAMKYPWGKDVTEADKNYYSKTSAADADKPIRATLNFAHMVGNVFCWCEDWYDKNAYGNPTGTREQKTRVLRGGKWYSYDKSLRCADRWNAFPETRSDFIGLRICRDTSGFVFN